jgi:hypothetical protein
MSDRYREDALTVAMGALAKKCRDTRKILDEWEEKTRFNYTHTERFVALHPIKRRLEEYQKLWVELRAELYGGEPPRIPGAKKTEEAK